MIFFFFCFDTTHGLKNVFNNFHSRRIFNYPYSDQVLTANFDHLQEILKIESTQSLRAAHKLSQGLLNPTSVSKVSAKHALGKKFVFQNNDRYYIILKLCKLSKCMYLFRVFFLYTYLHKPISISTYIVY